MRRRHSRVRGLAKVAADFTLLAAAINLARPGLTRHTDRWTTTPA